MPALARKGSRRVGLLSLDQHGDYRAVITIESCLDSKAAMKPSASSNSAARSNKRSHNKHNNGLQREKSFSSSTPASRIFHNVSSYMARAIRHLFTKKKGSSSGGHAEIMNVQSAQFVPPRDSHHSEAFEDCIEFINSSYRKSL